MINMKASVSLLLMLAKALAQNDTAPASNFPDDSMPVPIMEGVIICEEHFSDSENFSEIQHFCVNNAPCKQNFRETPNEPCDCTEGLTGPHCEFMVDRVPPCNIDCGDHGECHHGLENLGSVPEWMEMENVTFSRCACETGYSGIVCQDGPSFEDDVVPCGPYQCYNGGTCVQQPMLGSNLFSYFCDCTTAKDASTSWGGRFCQSESTSFCSKDPDHNGHQFCVNGGTCRDATHLGCDCPDGFIGPICEFTKVEIEHTTCNLKCENNGVCRKGAKDTSRLEKFGFNRSLDESFNEDFEHCVCPKGFVGLRCEHKMDVCPGVSHVCLNGAQCQGSNDGTGFHFDCNCRKADTDSKMFAGKYCEYESTELCTVDGGMPQAPAFCTNDGLCRGFIDKGAFHPGCRCKGEFEGEHCEIVSKPAPISRVSDDDNNQSKFHAMLIIGLSVGLAFFAVLALFFIVRHRQVNRQRHQRQTKSFVSSYSDPAPRPTLECIEEIEDEHDLNLYEEHFSDESSGGSSPPGQGDDRPVPTNAGDDRQLVRFDDRIETNLIV